MSDSQADTPEANAARNVVCYDLRERLWDVDWRWTDWIGGVTNKADACLCSDYSANLVARMARYVMDSSLIERARMEKLTLAYRAKKSSIYPRSSNPRSLRPQLRKKPLSRSESFSGRITLRSHLSNTMR